MLVALVAIALAAAAGEGDLHIKASLSGYNLLIPASRCCAFELEVLPDGRATATIQDEPKARVLHFKVPADQLAVLRKTLQEQTFFSLPEIVGSMATDGDFHIMAISVGKKKRSVRLHDWPADWKHADYMTKAELDQTWRAYSVWKILRSWVNDPKASVQ